MGWQCFSFSTFTFCLERVFFFSLRLWLRQFFSGCVSKTFQCLVLLSYCYLFRCFQCIFLLRYCVKLSNINNTYLSHIAHENRCTGRCSAKLIARALNVPKQILVAPTGYLLTPSSIHSLCRCFVCVSMHDLYEE